jgi:ATP-binding cassette subfamily B protein
MAWSTSAQWGGGPGNTVHVDGGDLEFEGIPPELADGVRRVIADEPVDVAAVQPFHQIDDDAQPLTLRRLVRPHAKALVLAAVLVLVETVSLQAGPALVRIAIDRGITPKPPHLSVVVLAAVLYIAAVITTAVASGLRVAWTGRIGQWLLYDLRLRVFSHLQRLSLDFFTEEKAGVIMTRMTSDIEALNQLFQDGIVNVAVQVLTMVFVTAVLFSYNVRLAAITVLLIVPTLGGLTWWFRGASDRGYARVRDGIARVLSDLQESLSGVRIVAAHNRQRYNAILHHEIVSEYRAANDYTAHLNAVYAPGADLIGMVGQVVLLIIGGQMALDHQLTVGELTAFLLYLGSFFAPIQQLVQLYNTYQQGRASTNKLRELLATQPSVAEAPDASVLPPLTGHIEFQDVSFGYSPAALVLRDVNLNIAAGETFALVGPTGAGKSTIAKLVTRFYDPTDGRVLIDGHDLRGVTFASLRRQLGVVPQEPFLFAGTIRDNIAFARPDASDEEILQAVRVVGLEDLIARLPGGLASPCHERGSTLSSGERQLLALARAFLARPRVLVLDEATSNLDLASEIKVERALDALLEGRTAIIIAHRLSTAMRADRIAVIGDGRVVELGCHDELVARRGPYAAMYATWMSHLRS